MNVGFMGLGKLGLPIALAMESKGHTVVGCDPSAEVGDIIESRRMTYREEHAQEFLERSSLRLTGLREVVRDAALIFVTIQTPHHPRYEGITRLPVERVDFDYSFLEAGMAALAKEIEALREDRTVVLVSTVLPGTIRRRIKPLLGPRVRLCYNPFFIAMGTAIRDFLEPEFVLLGVDDSDAAKQVAGFYRSIHDAQLFSTSLENAELIKVTYNTAISTKIAFINTIMEACHKLPGTDVDAVTDALRLATDRVISSSYLRGGMGDGGACHPRDNIALSYLSRELDLSFDWFENIMLQRERQTDWLVDLIVEHAQGRPVVVLGRSFKPETNITVGSPALLLMALMAERGVPAASWDPYLDDPAACPRGSPMCYFVATKHPDFLRFRFEPGSVVLDPWRYIGERDGIEIIGVGR